MPFQIDRAVSGLAMDFGPTVRAPRTLVFSWNQIETPKLRIGHDLFPQRSTPSRDDLDHCLHPPRFNRKSSLLQCLFAPVMTRRGAAKKIVIADIDPTVTFWPGVEIDRNVILATRKKNLAAGHATRADQYHDHEQCTA